MSCDRCSDVHEAQKAGLTNKKCECNCHSKVDWSAATSLTWDVGTNVTACTTDGCYDINLNNS